jgi:hypothetical protein
VKRNLRYLQRISSLTLNLEIMAATVARRMLNHSYPTNCSHIISVSLRVETMKSVYEPI